MTDPLVLMSVASAGVFAVLIVTAASLRGWRGWLDIRRLELTQHSAVGHAPASPATRIELADLKERVRKLEAIAAGVDL